MTWVWYLTPDDGFPEVEMDYEASTPLYSSIEFDNPKIFPPIQRPVFKTRGNLKKFLAKHCPPIGTDPVVDATWRKIIENFAPKESVDFLPVQLSARDGMTEEFSWVICFDCVECIDIKRSKIKNEVLGPDSHTLFEVEQYVHLKDCLGDKHIARDVRNPKHIVISDELRDALAATGEFTMFYRPKDVPPIFGLNTI